MLKAECQTTQKTELLYC